MISNVTLTEEDFLQQFPRAKEYMQDGLEFADWWEAGEDRTAQGAPINVADFAMAQNTKAKPKEKRIKYDANGRRV